MLPNLPILEPPKIETAIVLKVETKEPKKYIVKSGDTLTSISKAHNVPLERLWAKNTDLTDPNLIEPEKPLIIPENEEVLASRPLPEPAIIEVQTSARVANGPPSGGYSSSGNTYDFHSCTWHVKEMRPDIPNSWGNASQWLYNAQAMGWPTGSEPRAGAIGWTSGHVVYIIRVVGDRVYLSERNYDWNGSYRERWANASSLKYIY